MKKSRYTESQIFKILKEAESGVTVTRAVPQAWDERCQFL
jgi:hypothetical protein